jgi:hypothetical protein
MQIIYRAANIIDANLVKGALEHAGILAFVNGEYLTGGIGQLPMADLVSVMVADADVERAQTIADEIDAALRVEVETTDASLANLPPHIVG